ncbi:hypothetical protein Taro_014248 [Colocasia esculenta]|uniref:Uncharacterized protein n=1 Tax=Colocasia esculenta TaxID=4460 RepID=A0A843UIH5_COLES|nr:hypothetical protein [Colocasia esculenta]
MYYYRFSNTVIGYLNLLTLLASIPIIGGGLWSGVDYPLGFKLTQPIDTPTCERFLQTPLLIIGFFVLLVSLAGFMGACFNVP